MSNNEIDIHMSYGLDEESKRILLEAEADAQSSPDESKPNSKKNEKTNNNKDNSKKEYVNDASNEYEISDDKDEDDSDW